MYQFESKSVDTTGVYGPSLRKLLSAVYFVQSQMIFVRHIASSNESSVRQRSARKLGSKTAFC